MALAATRCVGQAGLSLPVLPASVRLPDGTPTRGDGRAAAAPLVQGARLRAGDARTIAGVAGQRNGRCASLGGSSSSGFVVGAHSWVAHVAGQVGDGSYGGLGSRKGSRSRSRCPSPWSSVVGVRAVLTESTELALGTKAPDFELLEPLTGKMVSLQEFEAYPALLVMFICNHCPFVKHLKPAITKLTEYYMQKGLGVVAISSNSIVTHPQDGPEQMAEDAREFKYKFPYLFDETQEVAKTYKAACTPEFYLFRKDGRRPFELVYHGQFDDSRPSNGKPVTGGDLRQALDCVLSGRPVSPLQQPSIGCNIKWTPGQEPDYFKS